MNPSSVYHNLLEASKVLLEYTPVSARQLQRYKVSVAIINKSTPKNLLPQPVLAAIQVGSDGSIHLVGDAVMVYALVYGVGVCVGAKYLSPFFGPYTSSPVP